MEPELPRSLRSDVLAMVSARAVVGLVNVGIVALIARSLGPAGQGQVAVGLTTLQVAVQLGNFGLSSAVTVWSVHTANVPRVIGAALWWSVGTGLLIGTTVGVVASATDTLSLTGPDAVVIALAAPLVLGASLMQGVLLGQGQARAMNIAEAASAVTALGAVSIALFAIDAGPVGAFAAAVSQFGLAFVAYLWIARSHLPRRARLDRGLAGELLRFSRWPFVAAVLGFLVVRVDLLLVDAILGADDAGRYAVAVTISQAVYLLPLAVGINLLPRAARGLSAGETERLLRRLALPYAGLCVVLWCFAGLIVRGVFGVEYDSSITLLRLLLPGTFALGVVAVVSYYFAATGYPIRAVVAWAIGLVVDLAINVAFLDSWGVEVAAVASTITYIGIAVANLRLFLTRRQNA